ncbi:Ger(x)C family spore germination protein [Paenibacillus aestuarii]|uniref:Ger(X)C family spore germination protein n=1 Tax=Paenibacillus aestuarii TaxID=516965 RepID=A0ABW0K383_9BACL|nr:Ger(x)C family spore germination protein [Paenibacillus aestuarii]
MNRCFFMIFLLAALCFNSGCGMKDLDKRFFVLAIGVDQSGVPDKPYHVSLKLGIPSPRIEPGNSNKYQLVTQDANSVTEAIRLLKSKVDKELDLGHAKIFVFGKSLASEDIQKPLDWFIRRRDIQKIGFVAVGDPTAEAVLDTRVSSERLPANSLFLSFDREGTESAYIMTENLSDFYRRMTERGLDPYLPVIRPRGQIFEIDQVAILDKHRIRAILNPDQTRILNQLTRNARKLDIHTNHQNENFDISIQHFKRKIHISNPNQNGMPDVRIEMKADGMVEESSRPLYDDDWNELAQSVQAQSKVRCMNVLALLQEKGVDPIGFGLHYRALGYVSDKDWQHWIDIYPNLNLQVNIKVKILGTGVVR